MPPRPIAHTLHFMDKTVSDDSTTSMTPGRRRARLRRRLGRVRRGAANMLDILRKGRISAPYRAPFEIAHEGAHYRLRRYRSEDASGSAAAGPAVLLVPPLMVAAEIYDISPELSAVSFLSEDGCDVWCVDYGAPEFIEGGMERDLGDHILSVVDAVGYIRATTGRDVHLVGYSQGGLFCYQAAAYLKADQIASIVTFGSPVDIRRALPVRVHDDLAERLLAAAGHALAGPLEHLDGLPSFLTARGFKLFNAAKEIQQIAGFFGMLHDREALERREPKRRFLGGEGFVAWPGPALRQFMEEIITHNRLAKGGLVVKGTPVSMADIDAPILYFVGARDDMVRAPAVRAVREWVPEAVTKERVVQAGHFGLVVGSSAMNISWPTVLDWVEWIDAGQDPASFDPDARTEPSPRGDGDHDRDQNAPIGPLYDLATDVLDGLWHRLGEVSLEFAGVVDALRWQLPRLAKVRQLTDDEPIGPSILLREQARAIPETSFFLWRNKSFTYDEVDREVTRHAVALRRAGVAPGDRVGLWLGADIDTLTAAMALNRLGAVTVPIATEATDAQVTEVVDAVDLRAIVTSPERVARTARLFSGDVWAQPPRGASNAGATSRYDLTSVPPDAIDAFTGPHHACKRRGDALSRLGARADARGDRHQHALERRRPRRRRRRAADRPRHRVYCPLPLDTPLGMILASGSALAGGSRLAIAEEGEDAWGEVRRYGASVVFYDRAWLDTLLATPRAPKEEHHPVRLWMGMGIDEERAATMRQRFGVVEVVDVFVQAAGNVCLINFGEHLDALGHEVPGARNATVIAWDAETGTPTRDAGGGAMRAAPGVAGRLIGRVGPWDPLLRFDGYLDTTHTEVAVLRDLFDAGDLWYDTGVEARRDADGVFWLVPDNE